MEPMILEYTVSADDFSGAGEASGDVKRTLKTLGFPPEIIRRVSVAMYEAEINMVIHARGGKITVEISPDEIRVCCEDVGPGIPDIGLAMQEGWSTASDKVRGMGFGAGMGLPNIKKYTDYLDIKTVVGQGTTLTMSVAV